VWAKVGLDWKAFSKRRLGSGQKTALHWISKQLTVAYSAVFSHKWFPELAKLAFLVVFPGLENIIYLILLLKTIANELHMSSFSRFPASHS